MEPVRVAILGSGRSGYDIHGASLNKIQSMYRIKVVVDELEDRRQRAHNAFGCETAAHYREVFERQDIDLVVNALPSHLHVPVSLEFLERGFNVLSEKPVARRAEDVDRLVGVAKNKQRHFAVFQQSRYSPAFRKILEVIESGRLGRIVQVTISYSGYARRWDWQTLKANNGGNLLNTGPHPVDQALQFFGAGDAPRVFCRMDSANSFGDAEDYVKLILSGDGHPTVDVEISSCQAYPSFTYNVQGTQGGLTGNLSQLKWRWFTPEEAPTQHLITTPLAKDDGSPAYCSEQLPWQEDHWEISQEAGADLFFAMTRDYYTMLFHSLTEGAPLEVTLEEVRRQIAVMEECFHQNPKFA